MRCWLTLNKTKENLCAQWNRKSGLSCPQACSIVQCDQADLPQASAILLCQIAAALNYPISTVHTKNLAQQYQVQHFKWNLKHPQMRLNVSGVPHKPQHKEHCKYFAAFKVSPEQFKVIINNIALWTKMSFISLTEYKHIMPAQTSWT